MLDSYQGCIVLELLQRQPALVHGIAGCAVVCSIPIINSLSLGDYLFGPLRLRHAMREVGA